MCLAVAGDLDGWAEMRGPSSTRSIAPSRTAEQGRPHTVATSLAPPRRAAVANVPGAGPMVPAPMVPAPERVVRQGIARVVA